MDCTLVGLAHEGPHLFKLKDWLRGAGATEAGTVGAPALWNFRTGKYEEPGAPFAFGPTPCSICGELVAGGMAGEVHRACVGSAAHRRPACVECGGIGGCVTCVRGRIDAALDGVEICACEESLALRSLLGECSGGGSDPRQVPLDLGLAQHLLGAQPQVETAGRAAEQAEESHDDGAEVARAGAVDPGREAQQRPACEPARREEGRVPESNPPSRPVKLGGARADDLGVVLRGGHGATLPEGAPAASVVDSIQRVLAWGWACAHCGVAWKGKLGDPCPECGAFGKRAVYEHEQLAECEACGCAYIDRSACPSCVRSRATAHERLARILVEKFDQEWDALFEGLGSFVGWSAAKARAKELAQRQRIALLAISDNRGAV